MLNAKIKKAMSFAQKAHNVQSYGECYPYFKHLEDVYKVLLEFGFNEERDLDLLVSSYLHDTLEDTTTSYIRLKNEFGEEVAELVYCVTDEIGRNRKEKHLKTYPKIRANPKSIILKVADRIANVRFSFQTSSDHFAMYVKEFPEFQTELRIYRQIDNMWDYLSNFLSGVSG